MKDLVMLRNRSMRAVLQTTAETVTSFNNLHYRDEPILRTKQRLFFMAYTIYFQKNSCLVRTFNMEIEKLLTHGLISSWVSSFIETKSTIISSASVAKPLNVRQFGGIFIISIILYAISIFVFILEIMSVRIHRIREVIEYFTFDG